MAMTKRMVRAVTSLQIYCNNVSNNLKDDYFYQGPPYGR